MTTSQRAAINVLAALLLLLLLGMMAAACGTFRPVVEFADRSRFMLFGMVERMASLHCHDDRSERA